MKLQGMAVIFAIITLPVILILSYFIQSQVNTITIQTSYDTKLLDATHDAMASFEINTANEDLSSVADSLRSIIQASNSVFLNTLSTNLGMSNASKAYLQPYLPAILYTLYDGYYIYAPTRVPVVSVNQLAETTDGDYEYQHMGTAEYDDDGIDLIYELNNTPGYIVKNGAAIIGGDKTTDIRDAKYKVDYVLKSYIPYSARYKNDSGVVDVTINYTLDNYITITGQIGEVYYTKSGYLINPDLVKSIKGVDDSGNEIFNLAVYNELEAEEICLSGKYNIEVVLNTEKPGGATEEITLRINKDEDRHIRQKEEDIKKIYEFLDEYNWTNIDTYIDELQELEYDVRMAKAATYYVKAKIFSEWVYSKLSSQIHESDIKEEYLGEMNKLYTTKTGGDVGSILYSFTDETMNLFSDPAVPSSMFNNHKREVIKSSIQYNLNLAMSSYNQMSVNTFSFNMPVIEEIQWDKITTNMSIVSFMQGFRAGFKTYNNYAVVSSTNNEMTVIPEEIYYVRREGFNDEESIYHRVDCPELLEDAEENPVNVNMIPDMISFKSKQVKYDKIFNIAYKRYQYDHRNLGCYKCVIGSTFEREKYLSGEGYEGYGNLDELPIALAENVRATEERGVGKGIDINRLSLSRKKIYYIGVGSERQSLYKFNAIKESQGYQVFSGATPNTQVTLSSVFIPEIEDVKELQITISNTEYEDYGIVVTACNVTLNGGGGGSIDFGDFTINLHQSKPQTIYVPVTRKSDW